MPLLKVVNAGKKFKKNGAQIIGAEHVSFSIEEGECLGLVGESGCGKSTVAAMIWPDWKNPGRGLRPF